MGTNTEKGSIPAVCTNTAASAFGVSDAEPKPNSVTAPSAPDGAGTPLASSDGPSGIEPIAAPPSGTGRRRGDPIGIESIAVPPSGTGSRGDAPALLQTDTSPSGTAAPTTGATAFEPALVAALVAARGATFEATLDPALDALFNADLGNTLEPASVGLTLEPSADATPIAAPPVEPTAAAVPTAAIAITGAL